MPTKTLCQIADHQNKTYIAVKQLIDDHGFYPVLEQLQHLCFASSQFANTRDEKSALQLISSIVHSASLAALRFLKNDLNAPATEAKTAVKKRKKKSR